MRPLSLLSRFRGDARGAVAVIMGIAIIPVLGLVGAAVDYSRASTVKSNLQDAADATALAAAMFVDLDNEQQFQTRARAFFDAQISMRESLGTYTVTIERNTDALVVVDVTADVKTSMLGIMGIKSIHMELEAAVEAGAGDVEIALALDTTGSMVDTMGDLRQAALDFVNIVTSNGSSDATRIALVPYVASVNIGNTAATRAILDRDGVTSHHASNIEFRLLGTTAEPRCWSGSSGGAATTPSGPADDSSGLDLDTTPFGRHLQEILGISPAMAAAPYAPVRLGSGTQMACWAFNPERISFWDLYELTDNVEWKGCVEARAEPYDVTDAAPSSGTDPNTLFVPYFWIDSVDAYGGSWPETNNNWLSDEPFLTTTSHEQEAWGRTYSVLKYIPGNTPNIDETPPGTLGPNKACGDEVLPLTNDYSVITSRIRNLSHWERGGTISSEGLAWAWRLLSPTPPFTEGSAYGEKRKIIVIMTDGVNMFIQNPDGSLVSDYTAYGYLRWTDRLPGNGDSFSAASNYLDQRLMAVCDNVKAAGIEIYAITFGLSDNNVRNMWDRCATQPSMAYHVDFASELSTAFSQIASGIGELRLVR